MKKVYQAFIGVKGANRPTTLLINSSKQALQKGILAYKVTSEDNICVDFVGCTQKERVELTHETYQLIKEWEEFQSLQKDLTFYTEQLFLSDANIKKLKREIDLQEQSAALHLKAKAELEAKMKSKTLLFGLNEPVEEANVLS